MLLGQRERSAFLLMRKKTFYDFAFKPAWLLGVAYKMWIDSFDVDIELVVDTLDYEISLV